jgi:hypothetical protein
MTAPTAVVFEAPTGALIYQDSTGKPFDDKAAQLFAGQLNAALKPEHQGMYQVLYLTPEEEAA